MFIFNESELFGALQIGIESFYNFIEVISSFDKIVFGWEMEDVTNMPDF
jgi:hypothetical protein